MTQQNSENRDWQTLVDSAYDKWQTRNDLDKDMRFSIMTNLEAVAVLFANLNYQVENGGFQQWITNDYGTSASLRALRSALDGTRELNPQVYGALLEFLEKAEPAIESWEAANGRMDDEEWEEFTSQLDTLDTAYYAFGDQMEAFYQAVLNGYDAQRSPFTVY